MACINVIINTTRIISPMHNPDNHLCHDENNTTSFGFSLSNRDYFKSTVLQYRPLRLNCDLTILIFDTFA